MTSAAFDISIGGRTDVVAVADGLPDGEVDGSELPDEHAVVRSNAAEVATTSWVAAIALFRIIPAVCRLR